MNGTPASAVARCSRSGPAASRSRAPLMVEGRLDEGGEERVRLPGAREELGMELTGHEPRVIGQLDDLHELLLGPDAGDAQPVLLELGQIVVVDLVAMAVALLDQSLPVGPRGGAALAQQDRIEAE